MQIFVSMQSLHSASFHTVAIQFKYIHAQCISRTGSYRSFIFASRNSRYVQVVSFFSLSCECNLGCLTVANKVISTIKTPKSTLNRFQNTHGAHIPAPTCESGLLFVSRLWLDMQYGMPFTLWLSHTFHSQCYAALIYNKHSYRIVSIAFYTNSRATFAAVYDSMPMSNTY